MKLISVNLISISALKHSNNNKCLMFMKVFAGNMFSSSKIYNQLCGLSCLYAKNKEISFKEVHIYMSFRETINGINVNICAFLKQSLQSQCP